MEVVLYSSWVKPCGLRHHHKWAWWCSKSLVTCSRGLLPWLSGWVLELYVYLLNSQPGMQKHNAMQGFENSWCAAVMQKELFYRGKHSTFTFREWWQGLLLGKPFSIHTHLILYLCKQLHRIIVPLFREAEADQRQKQFLEEEGIVPFSTVNCTRACLTAFPFLVGECLELHFDKYLRMQTQRAFSTGLCGSGISYAGSFSIASLKSSKQKNRFPFCKGNWKVVTGTF